MAGSSKPVVAKSSTPIAPSGGSGFDTFQGSANAYIQAQYSPKDVSITDTSLTSRPDAVASLNSVMTALFGRLATAAEQAQYIPELNAYQKSHPTIGNQHLEYDPATGKPKFGANTMTSTSVDSGAFFQSILQGTAEAGQYRVMNGYLGALQNLSNSARETM